MPLGGYRGAQRISDLLVDQFKLHSRPTKREDQKVNQEVKWLYDIITD